uniref:Mesencephalic astrocyte-derived neurotrophic factor homolog n=1 Tax=Plectus sambesii TaxID=2011161 RepID=A0A914WBU7_9BILA
MRSLLVTVFLVFATSSVLAAKKDQTCEVCTKVLGDVMTEIPAADAKNADKIAAKIRENCKVSKGKDNKFCFYIGALPESATSIMTDVSKPLSWSMPADKVCEKLRSKDQQICELKYDQAIDWKTVDLNKMRVKELKKILEDWGEQCKGCTEKTEFVARINELKPKFVKTEL